MRMFNPPHPGAMLREFMGRKVTVTALAEHLGMTRANLSMILNGRAGISALVALKLSEAFPQWEPEFWLTLQSNYDLWQASQVKRAKIRPIRISTQASSRKAA
jgi:addiction module HigA family antidote